MAHPFPSEPVPVNLAVTATCLLALLHFGRPVLQPIVLAMMLSLAVAPLIRALASAGLSRINATFATLGLVCTALVGGGMLLGRSC
ncbi:hypothetical protein [Pseudoduganella chitinolytica]|uniref:Uncharacterized protein n=1 Tax=Pseudoduganella chitinolytica TaxID=34070 RepID=A0ABY8BH12_9BURK|nr:hypothetical protein [Pseudoduganella chitinolytica]WEF35125.1 hypothetical protein PX653_10285 [Pseudoduganella chitinolytica]